MNNETYQDIIRAKICPYCGRPPVLVSSHVKYGDDFGLIYLCHPCDAWVGVHKGTHLSLGRLANADLREAKKLAHLYFDKIAKTGLINQIWPKIIPNTSNRSKAYLWLSEQMNIPVEFCHIGMFDIDECYQVVDICQPFV